MNTHAFRLLERTAAASRGWLVSLDGDTRARLVRWVLSCAYVDDAPANAEKRAFLLRAAPDGGDPKNTLQEVVAAAVTLLPHADRDALRRDLRANAPAIYRDIGHWRWLAYDDLPHFTDRTTQGWLREVSSDDLEILLKVEAPAFCDLIMRNLSGACGELIATYVAKATMPSAERVAAARSAILDGARKHLLEKHAETMEGEAEFDRLLPLAQGGDVKAQCDLAMMYWYGASGWLGEDEETALYWYAEAARRGSADGCYGAGLLCRELGRRDESLAWYIAGSERGDSNASLQAANHYNNDESPAYDPAQALAYYLKAAEQGGTHAYAQLGAMYALGEGTAQDDAAAREWFRKGAQASDPIRAPRFNECCFHYARFCEEGRGGERDIPAAVAAYRSAAERHSADAACNLGRLYCLGEGLTQDLAAAEKWFLQAAEDGCIEAYENMGILCNERGDRPQELMWASLGKELGSEVCGKEVDALAAGLSVEERRQADQMAAEWKERHRVLFPSPRKPHE